MIEPNAGYLRIVPQSFYSAAIDDTYVSPVTPSIYTAVVPATDYVLVAPSKPQMPAIQGSFPPIDAGIPQTLTFDFGKFLPPGVTLVGSPQVTVSVISGTDPNPQSRVTGGPSIGTAPTALKGTGVANAAILVQITPLGGVNYLVWVTCARSDGSDEASGWGPVFGQTPV